MESLHQVDLQAVLSSRPEPSAPAWPLRENQAVRVVSLRAFVSQMDRSASTGRTLPPDVLGMGGMSRPVGFCVAPKERDVFVFGPAGERDERSCRATWFLSALQCSFPVVRSDGPWCSLDPQSEEIRLLRDLSQRLGSIKGVNPETFKRATHRWMCHPSHQRVRIGGVREDSEFAAVMLEADILLKKVTAGVSGCRVPGVPSLGEVLADHYRTRFYMDYSRSLDEYRQAGEELMFRFWVNAPGPCQVVWQADANTAFVTPPSFEVQTEREYFSCLGLKEDNGEAPEPVRIFARALTERYDRLSAAFPAFERLRQAFVCLVFTRMLRETHALDKAGLALPGRLSSLNFPLEKPLPRYVETVRVCVHREWIRECEEGREVCLFILPLSGGIDWRPRFHRWCWA